MYVYIHVPLILTEHLPSDLCLISVNDEFSVLLNWPDKFGKKIKSVNKIASDRLKRHNCFQALFGSSDALATVW